MLTITRIDREGMSAAQSDTVDMLLSDCRQRKCVSQFSAYYDETDSTVQICFVEDGLQWLGYFDRRGTLIGDWTV